MSSELITSRLTSKSQTVIPLAIRKRLGLKPGDMIRYRIHGSNIEIEKSGDLSTPDPFAAFSEWASPEDDAAYGDL